MFRWMRMFTLTVLGCTFAPAGAHALPTCPLDVLIHPKNNTLYLYFPPSTDTSFPEYKDGEVEPDGTSPLARFNVADLDPAIGTTVELRKRITEMVTDDYCEFDVMVLGKNSKPNPVEDRWQIVGIGTDAATHDGTPVFGVSQGPDINDADGQDSTRVFAQSLKVEFGSPLGALGGSYSTLERWANAIAGVASHEAAHNYGADHSHAQSRPTEDDVTWHLMATYPDITGVIRAERDRHFSDTTYEVLGHNIGLSTRTLHNWDFVNPNKSPADRLRLTVLSKASSLSLNGWYKGDASPWAQPTVIAANLTKSFQGQTYKVHYVDFVTPKSWNGPTPGVVEAGAEFHTGATFAGNEAVIVYDVDLFYTDIPLPLAPRIPGYNPGAVNMKSGQYVIDLFNPDPSAGELVLSDIQVFRSPRMIDIASMMRDTRAVDSHDLPVAFHSQTRFASQTLRDTLTLPAGRLTDPRTVDIVYRPEDCPAEDPPGEPQGCPEGNALSLFPATYTYVVATVVEPNARQWNPERGAFVTGPLRTAVYYQVAGMVPDFNGNGVDDLIDIRTGTSRDDDRNGVPDEVRPGIE